MTRSFDLVIIGAGPAGMAASIEAGKRGLRVMIVDEQPAPGGQIWRGLEASIARHSDALFGSEYQAGTAVLRDFRSCGAVFEPNTRVWQLEPALKRPSGWGNGSKRVVGTAEPGSIHSWNVFMSRSQRAECVRASSVLLATGAQERPMPFPGWTLPGVLTVGAAQILLKTSFQVPRSPVWIAGSGPLPLLYMTQLLDAGGEIAGWLDTTPKGAWSRALPRIGHASVGWKDVLKGIGWSLNLRRAGFPIVRDVSSLKAIGDTRLEQIEYRTADGKSKRITADLMLIHEGVVPSIHFTQAMGCEHVWNANQTCFVPRLNSWGESSVSGIFVAGDGADIAGGRAACTRGQLAAIGIAVSAGFVTEDAALSLAQPLRQRLQTELATRPMLDAIYRPRAEIKSPSDGTVVCRCEDLSAGYIRDAAKLGQPGPNQVKAFTRAGMGPCQGRQCGYTVSNIIASVQCRPVAEVGFFHIRPPLKPVSLGEIASLEDESDIA